MKGQAPPLFTPQSSKFKIQILQPHQTWRVYESSRSKYSGTPPYGHLVNTVTSLLQSPFSGPEKRPYILSLKKPVNTVSC